MSDQRLTRERFLETVSKRVDADNLAEAALLIAAESYENLDVAGYLRQLDDLAEAADAKLGATTGPQRLLGLIDFLGRERGFSGNRDDYYDLRNSYLNEVLDRRVGIPITLALVYLEVGRRVGVELQGVGFPGHFLAVHNGHERTIIDPFFAAVLDEEACADRLRAVLGPDATFDEGLLQAVSPTQILVRMLSNLKLIHLRSKHFEQALACSERILIVEPDLITELRDRAALYLQLECFDAARSDLERFLAVAPDHESADLVHAELVKLRSSGPALH